MPEAMEMFERVVHHGNDPSDAQAQFVNSELWSFFSRFRDTEMFQDTHDGQVALSREDLTRLLVSTFSAHFSTKFRVLMSGPQLHLLARTGELMLTALIGYLPVNVTRAPNVPQNVRFFVFGNVRNAVANAAELVRKALPRQEREVPRVSWELVMDGRRISRNVEIDRPKPILPEYYPWLVEPLGDYFNRYLASEEAVLVLLGPTGTGKTSFIRNLIWHQLLPTKITYDELLLSTDALFFEFLTEADYKLLVVEDADVLLTSRDTAANKVMARFLNISDGLVGIHKQKKIIFTANILERNRIDEALLRDGRCFDVLNFRDLTYEEACAAARAANLPPVAHQRSYHLAELFSQRRRKPQGARIGF